VSINSAFDRWLKRVVLMLIGLFLILSCLAAWRVLVLIQCGSEKLSEMTETLNSIQNQLESLGGATEKAIEFAGLASELSDYLPGNASEPQETTEDRRDAEIYFLLTHIRDSGLQFQHDDDIHSAGRTYLKFRAKYLFLKSAVTTGEAFIERVASRQFDGDQYYVIRQAGGRYPLDDWLTEALQEYRSRTAGAQVSCPAPGVSYG